MSPVRTPPFRSLVDIQREITDIFDDVLLRGGEVIRAGLHRWSPRVDIYEEGSNLVLRAELPGMKREDIDIHVHGNVLTLRGERKREEEVKEEHYHRSERYFGSFSRSFTLPQHVDAERIEASYNDGVLTVTLPKTEESEPKKVEVR